MRRELGSLRNISICNRLGRKCSLDVTDRDKGRTGSSHPRSVKPGGPDLDLYIGAIKPVSKFDTEGVLHYAKVFPREMSPLYANSPSFISKLSKTAGQKHIDTPGTVYLEVFVDSPQGGIVLSSSFAGAAVQKTKGLADT